MEEKNTDQLQQELMTAGDLDEFLRQNVEDLDEGGLSEEIRRLLADRGLSKSALAKRSCTSEVYLHQILSGRRLPSRSKLLCLCFGLHTTVEEAQVLLRQARLAPLYPRDRRDAVVLYGLSHDMALETVNDKLFAENLDTLY